MKHLLSLRRCRVGLKSMCVVYQEMQPNVNANYENLTMRSTFVAPYDEIAADLRKYQSYC